jgi:CheY-like chemotaxis protein
MTKKLHCVMLIDDDEPTNFLNQLVIEKTGYVEQVITMSSAVEALHYLSNGSAQNPDFLRPDLIFLDINMPAMNGWEFLEEYKNLNEEQKARMMIVMLTTSLFPEDKEKALHISDVSGFEHKPLTRDKFERVLEKYTSKQVVELES